MRISSCLLSVALHLGLLLASVQSYAADAVGLQARTVDVPGRDNPISVKFWYPAESGGDLRLVGENKIFEGVAARQEASIADGKFPVVLLSHGGLRAAPQMSNWIAADLASRGFLVAVPQPPHLEDNDAGVAVHEIWRRPNDLRATLTALERDSALGPHLDLDKVGAVGFFLGATSALALAGARLDPASYRQSCDKPGLGMDCAWFEKNAVDLSLTDDHDLARSNRDARAKVAVAIDPELSHAFTESSLAAIRVPVVIINLGASDGIKPELDASGLAVRITTSHYQAVADATPFSAFSLCKKGGAEILEDLGEDGSICLDGGKRSRAALHAQLTDLIEAALKQ
jgi:predicted dienelactone hydrolase